MLKKKIMILCFTIISLFLLVGCASSYDKLNNEEQAVFDSLIVNLDSFYNYEDVKLIAATDIEGTYIFIELKGTNSFGTVMNRWYLLEIESGYIGDTHMDKGDIVDVDNWGLSFSINYNFNVDEFNNALVSYWGD